MTDEADSKPGSLIAGLPHGVEFRFLDSVEDLIAGKSARGSYRVKGTEPFLAGHFPNNPMMPGVLLVEAAAQLAGVIVHSLDSANPALKLTAIRSVKILGTAVPGETITIEATLIAVMGNLFQAAVAAKVGERVLMSGEVTLSGSIPRRDELPASLTLKCSSST